MKLHELLLETRSIRRFKQEEIPMEDLRDMINDVRLAPSGNNVNELRYIVITDKALRDEISKLTYYAASLPRELGEPKENEHAMAYILILSPKKPSIHMHVNTGIAAEILVLSAREKGIGSVMMKNFNVTKVNELLNVPEDYTAELLIPLGYADHTSTIVEVKDGDTHYYVDDDVNYYVPKYEIDDIATFK